MLKEVKKGVYSNGGLSLTNKGDIVLAVHPHYEFEPYRPVTNYLQEYKQNLEMILQEDCPVIVMATHLEFNRTTEKILNIRNNQTYFIKTAPQHPRPLEISWADFIIFLKSFKTEQIKLIGGSYSREKKYGCLWLVERILDCAGINTELQENVMFDYEQAKYYYG